MEAPAIARAGASFLSQVIFRKSSYSILILPFMIAKFRQFMADESGATAIEYGLIAAGISVAIITVVNGVGTQLKTTFTTITTKLATAGT